MGPTWPARALTVVALGALAAGCGGHDTGAGGGDSFAKGPPVDIADTAKADMKKLDSVTYSGKITSGTESISLDIQASSEGDCTGTIGLGAGTAQVVAENGVTWFRPDKTFWREQAPDQADAIIQTVGDKWVVDSNKEFARFCDLDQFFDQVFTSDDDASKYKTVGTGEVDGKQVVKVTNTGAKGASTGYILVDDPHYLVEVERTDGDEPGKIEFSDFDKPFTVQAPAADQVIDLTTQ
jgi:hypothetical protein